MRAASSTTTATKCRAVYTASAFRASTRSASIWRWIFIATAATIIRNTNAASRCSRCATKARPKNPALRLPGWPMIPSIPSPNTITTACARVCASFRTSIRASASCSTTSAPINHRFSSSKADCAASSSICQKRTTRFIRPRFTSSKPSKKKASRSSWRCSGPRHTRKSCCALPTTSATATAARTKPHSNRRSPA